MPALGLKDSSSHFNLLSSAICIAIANGMPKDWSIAIITPYKTQAQIIRGMIRDTFGKTSRVRSATVHSFQGSETEAVIFDVVDCAPRDSLGLLLRETNDRTADRLINVAITRAKYKFVMVANVSGMRSIYPQKGLLLRDLLDQTRISGHSIAGKDVMELLSLSPNNDKYHYYSSGSDPDAWDSFIDDINHAKEHVIVLMSRTLIGTPEQVNRLCKALDAAQQRGIPVEVYGKASRDLPPHTWIRVQDVGSLPNTAMAIIDDRVLWNGLPCSWLKDHDGTRLAYDPIFRISGGNAAREVSRIYGKKIDYQIKRNRPRAGKDQGGQLSLDLGL